MAWQETVEQTVVGLGFDLVGLELSGAGYLRVTIDWPWSAPEPGQALAERFVSVEDCEKVTRQLHYLLEVEGLDYHRLEVGSPGIDRPLNKPIDYVRFQGQVIDIQLKARIGVTDSNVGANRKKFRGTLEQAPDGVQWQVVWSDEPAAKPGVRVSKKRVPAPLQALVFTLEDVHLARLAPLVSFKGRKKPVPASPEVPVAERITP